MHYLKKNRIFFKRILIKKESGYTLLSLVIQAQCLAQQTNNPWTGLQGQTQSSAFIFKKTFIGADNAASTPSISKTNYASPAQPRIQSLW